jgi:hypothetical protein
VGQFEIHGAYQNDKSVPLCSHGKKEGKEKALQKEERAET